MTTADFSLYTSDIVKQASFPSGLNIALKCYTRWGSITVYILHCSVWQKSHYQSDFYRLPHFSNPVRLFIAKVISSISCPSVPIWKNV